MKHSPPIPSSPSEADYLEQVARAEPLAPLSDRDPIALFSQVSPADAQGEMKFLSYVGVKRLHSSLVPKTDPRKEVQPKLRVR